MCVKGNTTPNTASQVSSDKETRLKLNGVTSPMSIVNPDTLASQALLTNHPNFQISQSIFSRNMDALTDHALTSNERVYLGYLFGRCGQRGVTWRKQATISEELGWSRHSVWRVERALKKKKRLVVFSHGDLEYRSPWVTEAQEYLSRGAEKPLEAPASPTLQKSTEHVAELKPEPPPPPPPNPAPEQASMDLSTVPYKNHHENDNKIKTSTGPSAPVDKSEEVSNIKIIQPVTTTEPRSTTSNHPQQTKNPYSKNRYLVAHFAEDCADMLGQHHMVKWFMKLIWNLPEQAEEALVHAVSWVREEVHCCRCSNPVGLLIWKMNQDGFYPLTS